jgi:hypothetical protein
MASPLPGPPLSPAQLGQALATAQTPNRPHTARWSPVALVTFS